MWRLTFASSTVLLLTLPACSSHQTALPREPPPSNNPTSVRPAGTIKLSPLQIYEPGRLRYQVELKSVIQPVSGDSIHQADSIQARAVIAATFDNDKNNITARIEIDSTVLQSLNSVSTVLASRRFLFRINRETGQVLQDSVRRNRCVDTTDATSLFSGTEVLPTIDFSQSRSWTDSSEIQTCRGNIAIILSRRASYVILNQDSTDIQILRVTHVVLTGTGSQWNQRVSVSGQGIATDTLALVRSRLIHVSGSSQLKLHFQSSLRSQEYVQTITAKIGVQP